MKKVMLSAMQPTNRLTLGNYLGALRNWAAMQADYECLFFAVDLHSITLRQEPKELREATYRLIATYVAGGVDPEHALLFVQSHVPEHAELGWVLTCFTYEGELNRMTQYKDKSSKQGENIPAGLFMYPTLMAADILLYGTHLVPVGADQKQHLELTRDLAIRLNNLYGKDLFVVPEPYIPPIGARIMSLQDPTAKMSKSDPDPHATIFLDDSDDTIMKKVKRAVTDSGSEITYEDSKPGVKNLIGIQAALTGKHPDVIVGEYAGKMYGHLKVGTGELLCEKIGPIRDRVAELMADRAYLDGLLRAGAEKARARAQATLGKVYERVGFVGRSS